MSKAKTNYAGIDYGLGKTNRSESGIRFGVIPQNEVGQAWFDESKPQYDEECEMHCPDCALEFTGKVGDRIRCCCEKEFELELPEYAEPISFSYIGEGYKAECGEDGDIFIFESPYYTYAQFCSPCAPGACYLMSPLSEKIENNKCFCFDGSWFEDGVAPYPVYDCKTNQLVRR